MIALVVFHLICYVFSTQIFAESVFLFPFPLAFRISFLPSSWPSSTNWPMSQSIREPKIETKLFFVAIAISVLVQNSFAC